MKDSNSVSSYKRDNEEVLLVFPGRYRASNPQVPLSLLYIAGSLRSSGYNVRILDMRLENYDDFRMGKPLFVGISCMSGLQIQYALEFAKKVKATDPSCPIVWGGVHPSLLPEQTAANSYVDITVRGEGESTIVEIANKLSNCEPLDDVPGITFRSGGKIENNPDAQFINMDEIPVRLPYDLLQMEKYPSFRTGRFHIQTSRGCPHGCSFCYNSFFNKRKWRSKSSDRVLDEIEFVVENFPNVKIIDPIDDNFFVDKKRVENICEGIIERGIQTTWRANCRFDYMSRYDESFLNLLEKSGCVELDFGAESGSQRILSLIDKEITPEQMITSVENLKKWAPTIEPYVSWMSGLPTETEKDLRETFDLMDKMAETNNKTQHFGVFIYTPFPSPIIGSLGPQFEPPKSLEEWGNINVFHFRPPWHTKKYVDRLHTISAVTRYAFYPEARINERQAPFRLLYGFVNHIAKVRWRHRYFGIPIELKIINAFARKSRGYI